MALMCTMHAALMKPHHFVFGILFAIIAASAHGQNPREQLTQLVEQLRSHPNDNSLRERIIRLAQELKPPPAIPETARRPLVEGTVILQAAKDEKQIALAMESFKEALRFAPWWGDAYYNLGVAQETLGQFSDAEISLRLYLLTNPGEKEAREAQDRIYTLTAKRRLADAERENKARRQAESEAVRRAEQEQFGWLLGSWQGEASIPRFPQFRRALSLTFKRSGDVIESELCSGAPGGGPPECVGRGSDIRAILQPGGTLRWEIIVGNRSGEWSSGGCAARWQSAEIQFSNDRRVLRYLVPISEGTQRGDCILSRSTFQTITMTKQ